jgi:hypothetical protein
VTPIDEEDGMTTTIALRGGLASASESTADPP